MGEIDGSLELTKHKSRLPNFFDIISITYLFVPLNIVEKAKLRTVPRKLLWIIKLIFFSIGHCCEIDCCTAGRSGPVIRCNEGGEPRRLAATRAFRSQFPLLSRGILR